MRCCLKGFSPEANMFCFGRFFDIIRYIQFFMLRFLTYRKQYGKLIKNG